MNLPNLDLTAPVQASSLSDFVSPNPDTFSHDPWVDRQARNYAYPLKMGNASTEDRQLSIPKQFAHKFYLHKRIAKVKPEDVHKWTPSKIRALWSWVASFFSAETIAAMTKKQIDAFKERTLKYWNLVQYLSALPHLSALKIANSVHQFSSAALEEIHCSMTAAQKNYLYNPILKASAVGEFLRVVQKSTKGTIRLALVNLWRENMQACSLLFHALSQRKRKACIPYMTSKQLAAGLQYMQPTQASNLVNSLTIEKTRELIRHLSPGPVRDLLLHKKYIALETASRLELEVRIKELEEKLREELACKCECKCSENQKTN